MGDDYTNRSVNKGKKKKKKDIGLLGALAELARQGKKVKKPSGGLNAADMGRYGKAMKKARRPNKNLTSAFRKKVK